MQIRTTIRHCFSAIWNKQFLIFLFFLALSSIFWIFLRLSDTYEEEFLVPIELHNVPKNVVITTELPTHFRVVLRDKGSALITYRYTRPLKNLVLDYNTYATGSGHVSIQASTLVRQVASQLMASTQLVSSKPDVLEFYYNFGECKRVPVRICGTISASRRYTISNTLLSADSVLVYADRATLDTITAAYTWPLTLRSIEDTTKVQLQVAKVQGAKFKPSTIDATFCVDRVVEKTVQVPVQQVNFPASKQLRTFPASVNVTFQVGMGQYRQINSQNFVLVVNYEDLLKNKTNRCHLSLKTIPTGASHVRITPQDVDYIIEENPDTGDE